MTKFKFRNRQLASGTNHTYVWAQNNLGIVDQTSSTPAVAYYYELSRLYQSYLVSASAITIVADARNVTTEEVYIFVFPTVSNVPAVTPSTLTQALAFPNSRHVLMGPDTSGQGHVSIRHYCEVGALEGINPNDQALDYEGSFSTNFTTPGASPPTLNYWTTQAYASETGQSVSYDYTATITFWAKLYNIRPSAGQAFDDSLVPAEKPDPEDAPTYEDISPAADEYVTIKVKKDSIKH